MHPLGRPGIGAGYTIQDIGRFEPNRLREVDDLPLALVFLLPNIGTAKVVIGVFRIDANRLVVVGDRFVVFALFGLGFAPPLERSLDSLPQRVVARN
jgi:hypothetical protein